jgi:glutamate/tyrosine decarboxylase-like PLP-dependent enzyme
MASVQAVLECVFWRRWSRACLLVQARSPLRDQPAREDSMNDAAHPFDRHIAEKFFTKPAPTREFPAHSQDPFTAHALLQSEVVLDGDPSKNLATFVTTWMEPLARDVIAETCTGTTSTTQSTRVPRRSRRAAFG